MLFNLSKFLSVDAAIIKSGSSSIICSRLSSVITSAFSIYLAYCGLSLDQLSTPTIFTPMAITAPDTAPFITTTLSGSAGTSIGPFSDWYVIVFAFAISLGCSTVHALKINANTSIIGINNFFIFCLSF